VAGSQIDATASAAAGTLHTMSGDAAVAAKVAATVPVCVFAVVASAASNSL
jgi:hypothetical protein